MKGSNGQSKNSYCQNKVTHNQDNKQASKGTSSLPELLVAAKEIFIQCSLLILCYNCNKCCLDIFRSASSSRTRSCEKKEKVLNSDKLLSPASTCTLMLDT